MEYLILGLGTGLLTAFFCILFYRKGVRDGMGIRDNIPPPALKNPVKAVKEEIEKGEEAKKTRQEEQTILNQLNLLMEYQPEYVKVRD